MEYTRTKSENRLLVNPENWGVSENTYGIAPKYYYDLVYPCLDCSKLVMWSAEEQKLTPAVHPVALNLGDFSYAA